MAIRLTTNVHSVRAQKVLARNQRDMRVTTEKLASGVRIRSAADDAAGLGVSTKMRAHIKSIKAAQRNINDAMSLVQTADDAWGEAVGILSRMRELAVESSTEVLQDSERQYLQQEFVTLKDELGRLGDSVEFNGLELANGETPLVTVQIGIFRGAEQNSLRLRLGRMSDTFLGIGAESIKNSTSAQKALERIEGSFAIAGKFRAENGSNTNRLAIAMRNLETASENLIEAESRIRDADFAAETASLTRGQVFNQASIALLAQANSEPRAALALLT